MAHFYPFHALMPTPEKVAEVAAVPYDVVNSEEAAALAEGNPLSFLRVSRPEIEMTPGIDLYSDEVYAKAEANFKRLCAEMFSGQYHGGACALYGRNDPQFPGNASGNGDDLPDRRRPVRRGGLQQKFGYRHGRKLFGSVPGLSFGRLVPGDLWQL